MHTSDRPGAGPDPPIPAGPPASVLLITQDLNRAGAQRQCVELALGLGKLPGWHVEVLTLERGGPLEAVLHREAIPVHHVPRKWRWDPGPAWGIASLARRRRFDVVHSFMFLPNFYARLSRLRHRPPVIVSSHRSTRIRGRLRHVPEILMAPFCDFIIANSDSGRDYLISKGVSRRRVLVVRNGLDLERFRVGRHGFPQSGSPVRIGMIARMEVDKDQLGLVDAFSEVVRSHPAARLVLVGGGSRLEEVRDRVASLDLGQSVEIVGEVENPEAIYASLDLYAQPSLAAEGTSNSIIEAMASGLPIVATDSGGNAEIVAHGRTGLIVPPRDPRSLAAALRHLLDHPEEARRMGQDGAARAFMRFSRDRMIADTVDAYLAHLSGRPARRPLPTGSAPA